MSGSVWLSLPVPTVRQRFPFSGIISVHFLGFRGPGHFGFSVLHPGGHLEA